VRRNLTNEDFLLQWIIENFYETNDIGMIEATHDCDLPPNSLFIRANVIRDWDFARSPVRLLQKLTIPVEFFVLSFDRFYSLEEQLVRGKR
jgi:hypothetical protein